MSTLKDHLYDWVNSSNLFNIIEFTKTPSDNRFTIGSSITKKQVEELKSYNIDVLLRSCSAIGDELISKIKSEVITNLTKYIKEMDTPFDMSYIHSPICICSEFVSVKIMDRIGIPHYNMIGKLLTNDVDLFKEGEITYDQVSVPVYVDRTIPYGQNILINYEPNSLLVNFHIDSVTNDDILNMDIKDMPDVIDIRVDFSLDIKMRKPCESYKFKTLSYENEKME